jgi:pimeloyl-ACP methyl ester carboxylesterase
MASIYRTESGRNDVMNLYDKFLASVSNETESIQIPTSYGNTFCLRIGDKRKPPVIMLHGQGTNSASWFWFGLIELLKDDFCIYAIDTPGEPGKSDETRLSFRTNELPLWISEILKFLKIERIRIIGTSQGGWLAAKYASLFPSTVEKLILISPGGISGVKASFVFQSIKYGFRGESGIDDQLSLIFGPIAIPEAYREFTKMVFLKLKMRYDAPPLLSDIEIQRLNMQVYYFGGEKDPVFDSRKVAERIKHILPHAGIFIMAGESHAALGVKDHILKVL